MNPIISKNHKWTIEADQFRGWQYGAIRCACEQNLAFFHLYEIDDIDVVDYIETFPTVKCKVR
jgi:hypothetical protein